MIFINNIFDINGCILDAEQKRVVRANDENILVIAGAGSGKTLTIIGKIRYLIEQKHYQEKDILCISFTNETCDNLKNKLKNYYNYDIEVLTFHKLALQILKLNNLNYNIASSDEIDMIVDIFLNSTIFLNHNLIKYVLAYYNIFFTNRNYLKKYSKFQQSDNYLKLTKLIIRFLNLVKANDINLKQLIFNVQRQKDRKILIVIYAIYLEYEKELYSKMVIDFNDMISLAGKQNSHKLKYKYLIVDEYQDTSLLRNKLLKKVKNDNQAKLMVVGDDWQSIYGFSGCSLECFLNFKDMFFGKTYYLTTTYRNSQELAGIAGRFIMKNTKQLKKEIKTNKRIKDPIKIVYYQQRQKNLTELIKTLNLKGSLLILGRNNFDINKYLDFKIFKIDKKGYITFKNKSLVNSIRFLTVHKAKGLESDNVIILNLENDLYGFPSQLKNNRILNYITPKCDDYKFSEERRLFYVALTRSCNRVYLYTNKLKKSLFIKEIQRFLK